MTSPPNSPPRTCARFSEIAGSYDALLCDVWGVIHNGREAFPAACEALARYRAEVGPVVLISNSPRPHDQVIEQLDGLKVPREAWSEIVTSGDATRLLLAERAPGPAWKVGPDRDLPLYAGLGVEFSDLADAKFISVTGPYDDETETPADYRDRFIEARRRDLELICANPDIVVQRGDRLIYCGGALAQLYASLGGKVLMAGKPYPIIYDLSLMKAQEALARMEGGARSIDKARVLCIGDGLPTDIRGANAQGLDVLFVASGIHGGETIAADGTLNAAAVADLLRQDGLSATYAIADLVW